MKRIITQKSTECCESSEVCCKIAYMEKTGLESKVYKAIATSLVEFGYKDAVASMIQDTHKAMCEGKREEELPHGIIGRFAQSQLEEAVEKGLINIPESK